MSTLGLICFGVFVILLITGASLWIGVGLSIYWFSGVWGIRQIGKQAEREGNRREMDIGTEWLFRCIAIIAGGMFGLIGIGIFIYEYFYNKNEEGMKFTSWFE